jgi:hypothetical protein
VNIRTFPTMLALLGFLALLASPAEARKQEWRIETSQIVISDGAHHASVLQWAVPAALASVRVDQATLEFYVDAEDSESDTPFGVRVAPATDVSVEHGSYTLDNRYASSYAGSGPAADRRVVLDVTPAVRAWALQGGTAYLAILGEGQADRATTLSTGNLGGTTVARLTVWTSRR